MFDWYLFRIFSPYDVLIIIVVCTHFFNFHKNAKALQLWNRFCRKRIFWVVFLTFTVWQKKLREISRRRNAVFQAWNMTSSKLSKCCLSVCEEQPYPRFMDHHGIKMKQNYFILTLSFQLRKPSKIKEAKIVPCIILRKSLCLCFLLQCSTGKYVCICNICKFHVWSSKS